MSIREQIAVYLLVMLKGATVANGYAIGFGDNAKRAERSFNDCDLPACSLWLGNEDADPAHGISTQTMVVDIEAHAAVNSDTVDVTANELLADLRVALETYNSDLNDLIESINYTSSEPTYPNDGGKTISVRVTYLIQYTTARGNPSANH